MEATAAVVIYSNLVKPQLRSENSVGLHLGFKYMRMKQQYDKLMVEWRARKPSRATMELGGGGNLNEGLPQRDGETNLTHIMKIGKSQFRFQYGGLEYL